MKKTLLTLVVAGFTAASAFGQATILDSTLVKQSNNNAIVDVIGDVNMFQTSAILVQGAGNNVTFQIFTNWNAASHSFGGVGPFPSFGGVQVKTASIFLDTTGSKTPTSFQYAINFDIVGGNLQASLHATNSGVVRDSDHYFGGVGGVGYATEYIVPGEPAASPIAVRLDNPNATLASTSVTQLPLNIELVSGQTTTRVLEFTFNSALLANLFEDDLTLLWGTAICANDTIVGTIDGGDIGLVPEPSTYGLLGALLLLGMIAHRRLRK